MNIKLMLFLTIAACMGAEEQPKPVRPLKPHLIKPGPAKRWVLDKRFSDEFNSEKLDGSKWHWNMKPWGERSWSADNVYLRDGRLVLRTHYEPHEIKGQKYFYKLGMLLSNNKTTYGFFEAKIKGGSRFPGVCCGFWLFSNGKDLNPEYPHVTYSEIDVVEMLQEFYDPELKKKTGPRRIDCNLHTRVLDENGKEQWIRPNMKPELCKHHWEAPWDPRHDFHTYAVENTPEKITWFVDGQKVAEEENLYWHLPMSVCLNMELRPPFIGWEGVATRVPVPSAATPEGFPVEMEVDYVRCWILAND